MTVLLTLDESLDAAYWTDASSVLPTTSGGCTTLGYPAPNWLWLFDEPSGAFVDEIAGKSLVYFNQDPLHGRTFSGIKYGGSLTGKTCVEVQNGTSQTLVCDTGDVTTLDIGTEDFTVSALIKMRSVFLTSAGEWLIGHINFSGLGWLVFNTSATATNLYIKDGTGVSNIALAHQNLYDGAPHLLTLSCDRDGLLSLYLDGASTVTAAAARPGTLSDSGTRGQGLNYVGGVRAWCGQVAWLYVSKNGAADRSGHDALYAGLFPWGTSYTTRTRAGAVHVPISSSSVSGFAPGQAARIYDANTTETGLLAMQPVSFLGLGTANTQVWVGTSATNTAATGPSGRSSASRIKLTGAFGYVTSGSATLSGATNVPFRFGCYAKQATTGSELRIQAFFNGDPGGSETFAYIISSDAVPAGWTKYSGTCTPTRSAHTVCVVRIGCATNGNDVDVDEIWGVRNATVDPPGWIAVAAGSAVAVAPQAVEVDNNGSLLYGSKGVVQATLQNLNTISGKHTALWAESDNATPYLEMGASGADLYITIRDSSRSLVGTVTATNAITDTHHEVVWSWDAAAVVSGANHVAIKVDGSEVAAGVTSAWTPPDNDLLSPIGIGYGNAASELHGAFSSIIINDSLVSSVNGGLLTAVGDGDASLDAVLGQIASLSASGEGTADLTAITGILNSLDASGEGDASVTALVGHTASLDASGEGDAAMTAMVGISSGDLTAAGEGDATLIKVPGYTPHTHAEVNDSTTQAVVTSACHRTKAIVTEHWED